MFAVREDGERLYYGNGLLELQFCTRTGRWLGVRDMDLNRMIMDNGGRLSSLAVTYGGHTTVTTMRQQMWSILDTYAIGPNLLLDGYRTETEGDMEWLVLEMSEGDFRVYESFGFKKDSDRMCRRARIEWNGEEDILLRKVDFRTPAMAASAESLFEAPGYPDVLHKKLSTLPMGKWNLVPDGTDMDAPAGRAGVFGIDHPEFNLLVWGFNDLIPSLMTVNRYAWGVVYNQSMTASCRLERNQSIEVGALYMRLTHGDFKETLSGMQSFWEEVDVRIPQDRAEWARKAMIYELHIGVMDILKGEPHTPYPDARSVIDDLPRIAGLGFNCIEIMPHFPFPSYAVHDYMNAEIQYGTSEEELSELVSKAHQLGLNVFLDIVMHGVTDKSLNPKAIYDKHPLTVEHPEWFVRNEYDEMGTTYTWAFDHADPGFRDYMSRVCCFYVETFDVDGFRVDALNWNTFPNWRKGIGYPAFMSLYGSEEMYRMIRKAAHRIKPGVVFYTETAGPLYFRSYDLSYNYDEHWLFDDLLPKKSTREYFTFLKKPKGWEATPRMMAEWLELRRLAFPKGFTRVHHSDSHDSFTWGLLGNFKKYIYGEDGGRLYFALCALLDGGVMTYAGAEKGSESFYRQILTLCRENDALRDGTSDYLAVDSGHERVLVLHRRKDSRIALPVLSFSDSPVTAELQLDSLMADEESVYTLRELMTGEQRSGTGKELKRMVLQLPPYAVQVWTLQSGSA